MSHVTPRDVTTTEMEQRIISKADAQTWVTQKGINPLTGRKIKRGGPLYRRLEEAAAQHGVPLKCTVFRAPKNPYSLLNQFQGFLWDNLNKAFNHCHWLLEFDRSKLKPVFTPTLVILHGRMTCFRSFPGWYEHMEGTEGESAYTKGVLGSVGFEVEPSTGHVRVHYMPAVQNIWQPVERELVQYAREHWLKSV